jgi:hypothetical protein
MGNMRPFSLLGKTSVYRTQLYPEIKLKNFQHRWTPEETSLFSWFDASDKSTINLSGGVVETILDKSPNGASLTANIASGQTKNHTLIPGGQNSLDVISLDGEDFYSSSPVALSSSGNLTCFIVCNVTTVDNAIDSILSAIGLTSFQLQAGNSSQFRCMLNASGIGGTTTGPSTHGNFIGLYHIFEVVMDFNSSQCLIYVDGSDITNTPLAYTTKLDTDKVFRVFTNRGNSQQPAGLLAELSIIENVDQQTRQKMEGYLAHKWGFSDNLPDSNPYKYQPRYFI